MRTDNLNILIQQFADFLKTHVEAILIIHYSVPIGYTKSFFTHIMFPPSLFASFKDYILNHTDVIFSSFQFIQHFFKFSLES